jgi:regulatory protein
LPAAQRRPARPITAQGLEQAALVYLERFASSAANLRRVLLRRVRRAALAGLGDPAEGAALVEALVARFLAAGLLDDRRFAEGRAASLHRRGSSRRIIAGRLAQQGIAADLIGATLEGLAETTAEPELAAACVFIRRRRLGAYRGGKAGSPEKEMAALGRAGFSREIARRVLACRDIETVEQLARGASELGSS